MNFTDIFIRRPVLASVVSLVILVLGLRSVMSLPILQYPRTENAVIVVTTIYYGADPELVAGFITTPLENAIAQANGIDYMTSTSQSGQSTITVNLRLNYDADKALSEISAKINSVINQLPNGTLQPSLVVQIGQTIDAMYIGFKSKQLGANQITDYIVRAVQPKLQAINGVQTAELIGAKNFALRAWLDPLKLAAYGLTAADVTTALANNDYIAGLGKTKGQMVQINLTASTNLRSREEFANLIVKNVNNAPVRLRDLARVTLGADDYDSAAGYDGQQAVYVGIQVAPTANLLTVAEGIRKIFPGIQSQLPGGLDGKIIYDSTAFVNSSISEVEHTLIEALLIVTAVIFAFLASLRSVLIPVIAIPLSLVGAFTIMQACGFSINLLSLLALVLAIGLVVDDAIIVVESVTRHLENGMSPRDAASLAARELASPIVAMTVVLVAVYVPIGFQTGLTGALFTEFAFTMVGAVTVSAVIALTLSPMLCSKILKPREENRHGWQERFADFVDRHFTKFQNFYIRWLERCLHNLPVVAVFAVLILGSIYFLALGAHSELAPQEDEGAILGLSTAASNSTLQQRQIYSKQEYQIFTRHPQTSLVFQIDAPGQTIAGVVLKPWDQRSVTTNQLQPKIQQELKQIAGEQVVVFQPPPLPGSNGLPVQFVLTTTQPFDQLNKVAAKFIQQAIASGNFIFLNTDLKYDEPESTVTIDRNITAQLGLTMSNVGAALSSLLGGGYVNYFDLAQRSYKVIPQVEQAYRLNTQQLLDYPVASTSSGIPISLSTIAKITTTTVPESINHFQQLNSATIQGVPVPGRALGDVLTYLKKLAAESLPAGYSVEYGGQSRQSVQESSSLVTTFALAIILIFLCLAALFESFRDPLIILVSVPMSICGAMIFISLGLGGLTLNIYTEVGLVTLIGLISKHGILIVEVANTLQQEGKSKWDAIIGSVEIRLRPILMTTAAMVFGVVPLIIATGAGAVSRVNLGLVIAAGLSIGTIFTLFVVPSFYLMLAENHAESKSKAQESA
jgi:multidrug efflux pump